MVSVSNRECYLDFGWIFDRIGGPLPKTKSHQLYHWSMCNNFFPHASNTRNHFAHRMLFDSVHHCQLHDDLVVLSDSEFLQHGRWYLRLNQFEIFHERPIILWISL